MSFAGHVFDMIRRDKENRELRNRRREKRKDMQETSLHSESVNEQPAITLEELEKINRQLKERELNEQRYRSCILLGILCATLLVIVVLVIIFKWL
ncbi:MAG: hypothetical protein LIO97_13435 [Tannerellaceae bacterium]|nr:hypothetical protein [Tannerellaceae bacterium]